MTVSWRVSAWQRLSLILTWACRAWYLHHLRNLREGIREPAEIRAINLMIIVYQIQRLFSGGAHEYFTSSDEDSEILDNFQRSIRPPSEDSDLVEIAEEFRTSLAELDREGDVSGSFHSPSDWESEASTLGSNAP